MSWSPQVWDTGTWDDNVWRFTTGGGAVPLKITRGFIQVVRDDGTLVSNHNQFKEALESAANAALDNPDETILIKTPDARVVYEP